MIDVGPMNLQVMVPKSTEVGQIQHNINQQAIVEQEFAANREKADAELKQQQVRSREEMEDGKIKEEPERKKQDRGSFGGSRHNSSAQEEEEPEEERMAVDTYRGHMIDIKF